MTYGGAGVRHDSPVSPPGPKSFLWKEHRATFSFFFYFFFPSALSNGSSSSSLLPPSFPPSLLPALPLFSASLSHSLSPFFSPLALRHSLVTARSSNRTTLILTRTRGSPEMPHGAPFGRRELKWKRKRSFCSFFYVCHGADSSYRHKGIVF